MPKAASARLQARLVPSPHLVGSSSLGGEASLLGEERDCGWAWVSVPLAMGPLARGGGTIMTDFVEGVGS